MARVSMVTRTVTSTKAVIMCADVTKGETFQKEIVLPRTYKDDTAILKAAEKVLNTETVKAVHTVSSIEEEHLYGMTEQKFIELADVLPPRGTKANG